MRTLCLLTAAVLGLTAPAVAAAEPTSPPPTTETTETPETTGTPMPSPSPEPEAARAPVHDLTMAATFDKPSYHTGEDMTITVTVANTGAEPVTAYANFLYVEPDMIHVFRTNPFEKGERFTLAAGASITRTITGAMHNPDLTVGTLYGWLVGETHESVLWRSTVPITRTRGDVSGVVYYDRNRNHRFDAGEGQRDVTLTWENQYHYQTKRTVTTDANGAFRLVGLPTGSYSVNGEGLGGLRVGHARVVVGPSGVDGLQLPGAAPLTGLIPKLEFAKDTYASDEAPVVRVTLENTSDMVLSGIVATCNRTGEPDSLTGIGAGWGDLTRDGVDLPPNSTLTFDVTEPMPARSPAVGYVHVGCEFGYRGVESEHNRFSYDYAAVPGMRADLVGSAGVAGARLVVVPDLAYLPNQQCAVVAETVTGADGGFAFLSLPVGFYMVYVFPPAGWRVKHDNPKRIMVASDLSVGRSIMMVPGEAPAPVLPACLSGGGGRAIPATTAPVTTTRPAPQAARAPTLAHTGASVLAPGVTGLLALLVGTALVLVTRRREST